jgi:hypothetical protein
MLNHIIDIPFSHRNHCWFCGEPSQNHVDFPQKQYPLFDCAHPSLAVPSCKECANWANKTISDHHVVQPVLSIWQLTTEVKSLLAIKYRKDLAIGLNWTQDELANSEFEQGNFEGFKKSAWFMYEVAKTRLNFNGWELSLDGIDIECEDDLNSFNFDGVVYPSIEHAIEHYAYSYYLPKDFFKAVLAKLGTTNFAKAVRYCRLFVDATPLERQRALKEL